MRGRRDRSAAPPLHVHTREEECFYVIAGAITCYVGDEIVDVPAGGFIVLPRDLPHRYELASEEARLLNLCVPAGFEGFYRALSEPALQPILPPPPESPPDGARMLAAAAAHGVEILAAPAANGGSTPVPHAPARAIDHEPPCQPHGPRPRGMTWTATVSTA